jgi:hypothetical protein
MKIPTVLTGISGEYFVAAELSRRGYVASISLRNTDGVDILATNKSKRSITIQVKTSQMKRKDWMLTKKCEDYISANHFYIFVGLGETNEERPSYHIFPSKVVANQTKTSHKNWMRGRRRDGRKRANTSMRRLFDQDNRFLDRWDLLGL